ncbi:MAG: hypothetical protein GX820_09500, partial [Bacteroidales bacterium]|nr:hypothetical protein [Bacteroidales bacterium]
MKPRLIILSIFALFTGACTSGAYITRYYTDDIYFNPGSVPPPIIMEEESLAREPIREKSANRVVLSNIEENQEGSHTMSNYIFDGSKEDAEAFRYGMDQFDMYDSDTTVYYDDDEVKYVINNYYNSDEIDYAYRIRRFHRPYFYDPFYWSSWYYDPFFYDPYYYSSWYYPHWSYSWNWGWGYNWYSPYYSWGLGYSPYYSYWNRSYYGGYYGWGYPYYGWHGYGGRYYADSENYRYGRRDEGNTNAYYGGDGGRRVSTSAARGTTIVPKSGQTDTGISSQAYRRGTASGDANTRQDGSVNSNVLTERRRSTTSVSGDQPVKSGTTVSNRTYTRPGTTESSRTYARPYTGSSTTTPRVVTSKSGSATPSTGQQQGTTSTYNRNYRT